MPRPRLLHPVPVTIERLDRASTVYDEDAREPVSQARRFAPLTIPAQIHWLDQAEALQTNKVGPSESLTGYVLLLMEDMKQRDFMIKINDRITKMGTLTVEVYVTRLQWTGHYPSEGGWSMVKAWFSDRLPAKAR